MCECIIELRSSGKVAAGKPTQIDSVVVLLLLFWFSFSFAFALFSLYLLPSFPPSLSRSLALFLSPAVVAMDQGACWVVAGPCEYYYHDGAPLLPNGLHRMSIFPKKRLSSRSENAASQAVRSLSLSFSLLALLLLLLSLYPTVLHKLSLSFFLPLSLSLLFLCHFF